MFGVNFTSHGANLPLGSHLFDDPDLRGMPYDVRSQWGSIEVRYDNSNEVSNPPHILWLMQRYRAGKYCFDRHPIVVDRDGCIATGRHRHAAAFLLGIEHLYAWRVDWVYGEERVEVDA